MDRLDAMRVFVAALDAGSLAGAGRRLGHSPAAVSRAVAFLESHVGVPLLHRTTRSLRLSEAGERYAAACRRVLADLEEADLLAAGERAAPRGLITVTAPLVAGTRVLRPILDAFLDAEPAVRARLLLLDRPMSLVEEGVDVALRIAHLPDSSLVALKVGAVRRVVCAAPAYLAHRPAVTEPADLAGHAVIATTSVGQDAPPDSWAFHGPDGTPRVVRVAPRLVVNGIEAALDSALAGHGLLRCFSYQVAEAVRDGRLSVLLPHAEPAPLPVHLVTPEGRLAVPKMRAFVDFALPRLRGAFERLALGG
ncbi:LysR family transcriptional regulator [Methylobacterium indicum]|uniref:LysR family transcriptional regulator n=1 Tax=Methylobacterium indicum TaxID=1775910 RepID=A0ABR5GNZ7_9HYPH|nr:LysR family transcriptional regulator [Methylobacterium indicum]KMO10577.1 LysR family transcriptional regulator [Methylobacterium indicum]KMO24316.1 LysR family transcriptional regulator [Methylobacterium indicum]